MKKTKPPIPTVVNLRNVNAATITKVSDVTNTNEPVVLDHNNTSAVSESVSAKISSNEEILQLFPDVEISMQILVSSILAPNDMLSTALNYSMENCYIPNNINSNILDQIRSHVERNYQLESKLTTILREALFTKGAYVEVIIPDTDILKLQADLKESLSTEDLLDNMTYNKFLSSEDSVTLSVESISSKGTTSNVAAITTEDLGISFLEDLNALRVPTAYANNVTNTVLSTERAGVLTSKRTSFSSFMRKKLTTNTVFSVNANNENGSPMAMKLPVESVLPIHLTSDPSKHISYLVLLDENGVPVTGKTGLSSNNKAQQPKNNEKVDMKATIISKANLALNSKLQSDTKLTNVDDIYTTALVTSIRKHVQNGLLGKSVNIPEQSDVYQTVFTRALKGLKTRMLFIPKENLNYFAFEYRENGTGKSLLEKSIMLFSIRAANLFTRIMANVKNSVTTTKVTAVLDETDPDPEHTKELIINHAMKAERVKYPIGMTSVRDLVDWMHNVGYRFDIKHPALPEIEIDISEDTRNLAEPDTDFDDMVQEQIIMSFGLKKDMVMAGYDSDFATTAVANNVLFAKRIMTHQNTFTPQLSSYVQKVLLNDGLLKEKIIDTIISNISTIRKLLKKSLSKEEWLEHKEHLENDNELAEVVYSEYTTSIKTILPKIDIKSEEGSMDGLDAFSSMLDTYLPMIISSETLPQELVGDISDKMDDIMSAIKTVLIKNWMDDRNFLPELTKFLTLDNMGQPRYDILEEYNDFTAILSKAIIPHLKKLKKSSNITDSKLDKIDNDDGTEEPVPEDAVPADGAEDNVSSEEPDITEL